jgi:hypothetical protein
VALSGQTELGQGVVNKISECNALFPLLVFIIFPFRRNDIRLSRLQLKSEQIKMLDLNHLKRDIKIRAQVVSGRKTKAASTIEHTEAKRPSNDSKLHSLGFCKREWPPPARS